MPDALLKQRRIISLSLSSARELINGGQRASVYNVYASHPFVAVSIRAMLSLFLCVWMYICVCRGTWYIEGGGCRRVPAVRVCVDAAAAAAVIHTTCGRFRREFFGQTRLGACIIVDIPERI